MKITNKVIKKVTANVFQSATFELPSILISWLMRGLMYRTSITEDFSEKAFIQLGYFNKLLLEVERQFANSETVIKESLKQLANTGGTKYHLHLITLNAGQLNAILYSLKGMIDHCSQTDDELFNLTSFKLINQLYVELLEQKSIADTLKSIKVLDGIGYWDTKSDEEIDKLKNDCNIKVQADKKHIINMICAYDFLGNKDRLSNLGAANLNDIANGYGISYNNEIVNVNDLIRAITKHQLTM